MCICECLHSLEYKEPPLVNITCTAIFCYIALFVCGVLHQLHLSTPAAANISKKIFCWFFIFFKLFISLFLHLNLLYNISYLLHLYLKINCIFSLNSCCPGIWRELFLKKKMVKIAAIFTVLIFLISSSSSSSVNAQAVTSPAPALSPTPTPAPAPAPGPAFVNLTDLLTVAGPFQTFLNYLVSTKVIETFQNQANDTDEGITIFVPKDKAFSSLKKPSLKNLTQDQLKSFLLFHALPHYYSLSDFKNLSQSSPVSTFAGGQFSLNFTDVSGTVHMTSGWTDTKVSSSVHSTDPVAIYQIDKVLIPEAIFGTPPPPAPAPAPTPDIAPAADSPASGLKGSELSPKSSSPSSSYRIMSWGIFNYLVLATGLTGFMVLF